MITFGGLGIWVTIDVVLILSGNTKAKDGTDLHDYKKNLKAALIILVVWLLLMVATTIYNAMALGKTINLLNNTTTICNGNTCSTTKNSSLQSTDTVTPLGMAVTAENFSLKVTKVVLDPKVTGDKPDKGTQYLEVDLSFTNNGTQETSTPGTFIYQTTDGKELFDANMHSTMEGSPNKNVLLVGRETLSALFMKPGQTNSSYSQVFQIPQGDKGKMIWREDTLSDSIKFATFQLF